MWTRNYKNLIRAHASCVLYGSTSSSVRPWAQNYHFNFKAPSGTVYEFYTGYPNQTSDYYWHQYSSPAFCSLNVDSFYVPVEYLTTQTGAPSNSNMMAGIGVAYGSGTSDETEMDYKVEKIINTLNSSSLTKNAYLNDDGTITINVNHIVYANAETTISEIGIFLPVHYAPGTNSSNYYKKWMLANRIVLDTPVQIPAEGVGRVVFSFTTPNISFSE